MSILKEIYIRKKKEVEKLKSNCSDNRFKKIKESRSQFLNVLEEKNSKTFNLIAEIKKKSPSLGLITNNFNPTNIATNYFKAGAKCLSVLTDEYFFGGKLDYINDIKERIDIPILRKDFIVDKWQIYESIHFKADCILIILAMITDKDAKLFFDIASDCGLDVIFEVHNLEELERAINLDPRCIGINNRNLKTFKVDLNSFKNLTCYIPKKIIKICESGISENAQLIEMSKFGADAFLVGEYLMKQKDIFEATRDLIKK